MSASRVVRARYLIIGILRHQSMVRFEVSQIAQVADTAGVQDLPRVPVAEQLPQHVVVRGLAGARAEEDDGVPRLDGIERVMPGDLLADVRAVAFPEA